MHYNEVEKEIIEGISSLFPSIRIFSDSYTNTEEKYILINDENVYNSSEYKSFVLGVKKNLLLANGIGSVFFSYISSQSELSKNAIQLYEPVNEVYNIYTDIVGSAVFVKPEKIGTLPSGFASMTYKREKSGNYFLGDTKICPTSPLSVAA